jgi:hypothetical protein
MNFEMKIFDVFHLQSGQTVFAGSVTGTKSLIKNFEATLLVDGKISQIVEIDGEFMMNIRHPDGHRAISTKNPVDLTSEFVKKHECILEGVILN